MTHEQLVAWFCIEGFLPIADPHSTDPRGARFYSVFREGVNVAQAVLDKTDISYAKGYITVAYSHGWRAEDAADWSAVPVEVLQALYEKVVTL